MKKRRLPPEDMVSRISESMKLLPDEAEYIAALVAAERARITQSFALADLEKKLQTLQFQHNKKVMPNADLEPLLSPAFMAIKVLLESGLPSLTFDSIRERLRIEVAPETLQSILGRLAELRIIEVDSAGHYHSLVKNIETQDDLPSSAIRAFHRESLNLAIDALETVPLQKRHFSSYVLAVEPSRVAEAKKALEKFIDSFVAEFEAKPAGNPSVYQLNLNLLPLSQDSSGSPE